MGLFLMSTPKRIKRDTGAFQTLLFECVLPLYEETRVVPPVVTGCSAIFSFFFINVTYQGKNNVLEVRLNYWTSC